MLLEHIKGIKPDTELTEEIVEIEAKITKIMEAVPLPGSVDVNDAYDFNEISTAMDAVMKQLKAAKEGLGLVNKLGDSPSRTTNRSRIMGNLNRIRGNLRRIEKMFDAIMGQDPTLRSEMNFARRGA